ncbi:MAG: hypothetical protein WCJ57_03320 [Candidatus Falkowbacteria bacterium]
MSKKNKKMAQSRAEKNVVKNIAWEIPEYEKHEKNRNWYIIAGVIALALIAYAVFTRNYLFALIIVIIAFIIITRDGQDPIVVTFSIEPTGVGVGQRFYSYDTFKDFAVVYRPKDNIKGLYLNFKNTMRPHLSIPLKDANPVEVRNYLVRFLAEDLERNDAPLSEGLSKALKL